MNHPNILFVFADQLRYSATGFGGNRTVRTSNLDRLAGEGVIFNQAFSGCPVCSPYRGQVLTGNYSHVNGVIDNEYRLFDDQRTLAHRLAEHGYRSAYIGKWHLGLGPYPQRSRYGFDDLLAYNCQHHYYKVEYFHNEAGPFRMVEYAPRYETTLALDWIARHRRSHGDRPFCAVLGWGPPHWTRGGGDNAYGQYPREYRVYDPDRIDVPDNVPRPLRRFAAEEIADYYAMVTSLDDCFGRLMAGLERMGIADDTIICFSSDHGDHLSAHGFGKPAEEWMPPTRRASKITPYEESVHIPLMIRYPQRIAPGRRTDTLFNSVDVLPTIMDLAGLPAAADVQGRNLSHAALGTDGPEPDSVYLQILGPGWPPRPVLTGLWRGIRTREWLYARWHDREGMRILHDRKADPLEMTDLIDDPAYADVAERMEKRLQQWMAETRDPFDSGPRLPVTGMLDLGQATTSRRSHDWLPAEYAKAIEPNYANFQTGEPISFP